MKLSAAVLMLAILSGCDRDDNGPGVKNSTPVVPSLTANPLELAYVSTDLFRTGTPVSHYFGNLEVSLYAEYCDHSGRELRTRRYGAVALAEEGSVLRFRSVEDLVWYMQSKELEFEDFQVIGIVDFISARRLMKPEDLVFHLSRNLRSPGGSWVSAMDPEADPSLLYNIGEAYPGTRHSWDEVRTYLYEKRKRFDALYESYAEIN